MKYQMYVFVLALFLMLTFTRQGYSNIPFMGGTGGGYASVKLKINEVSGVSEQNKVSEFKLYPNPLAENKTLYLLAENFSETEKALLYIYDSKLRLLRNEHFIVSETTTLSLNLPAGIYFLQIRVSEEVNTKKLIIY
ncbi:MAG: T9SS C-terminal target domain-containing protein [Chitinophagaceae bacterium]|nr:MAG: T9SS C-terminal target domain-containing protein [Chitinophagaceae bacterium]